jgi:hypothetical protein
MLDFELGVVELSPAHLLPPWKDDPVAERRWLLEEIAHRPGIVARGFQ